MSLFDVACFQPCPCLTLPFTILPFLAVPYIIPPFPSLPHPTVATSFSACIPDMNSTFHLLSLLTAYLLKKSPSTSNSFFLFLLLVPQDVRGEDKLGGIAELIQRLIDSGDVLGCQVMYNFFISSYLKNSCLHTTI